MNNNPLTSLQEAAIQIIKERHLGNEITGAELSRVLGIKEAKDKAGANMRSVVNSLRDKGKVVCANSKGYFYPKNVDELREYADQFQARIDEQQRACDTLKQRVVDWHSFNKKRAAEAQERLANQQGRLL